MKSLLLQSYEDKLETIRNYIGNEFDAIKSAIKSSARATLEAANDEFLVAISELKLKVIFLVDLFRVYVGYSGWHTDCSQYAWSKSS